MTAAKYMLAPSVVAERISAEVDVAELHELIRQMDESWSRRGTTPDPETIAAVIRKHRAMTHFARAA